MTDYRRIVDEIRAYMKARDQTDDVRIQQLAREYAQICGDVNTRLLQCEQLLQQGLRSEAIELAEVEPNLIDTVALLDFDVRSAWEDISSSYGWQRTSGVKFDTAVLLNDAYAMEESLRPLLNKHRRAAMSRAPLEQRIDVIRQIAAIDRTSPYWNEDLRTLENARIRQLILMARQAEKEGNLERLADVVNELELEPWIEKFTKGMSKEVSRLATIVIEQRTLPDIAKRLNQECQLESYRPSKQSDRAYDRVNHAGLERARALSEEWRQAIKRASAGNPNWRLAPELLAMVEEPFRLLEQQENRAAEDHVFAACVGKLMQAVEADASLAELRHLELAVVVYGRSVPSPVARPLGALRRKRYLRYGLFTAFCAAIVFFTVFFLGLIFKIF